MKKVFSLLIVTTIISSCGGSNTSKGSDNESDANIVLTEEVSEKIDDSYDPSEDLEEIPPSVSVSEDGVITIETAMYPTMATAPDYWSRWKFKNKDGKECEVYRAESPFVQAVYSIKKNDGSTYYITNCFGRASSADGYKWLEAYKIVGDTIEQVNVVDGGSKADSSDDDFSIEYCIQNDYYVPFGDSDYWTFVYNPQTREFYVPLIAGPTFFESYATDRYILWQFDGDQFVNLGEKPNKDLNPSLSDYVNLVKYFETQDYIVRVDSLDSEELRYASWKKPKTTKESPDMVLKGGKRKVYKVQEDQVEPCVDYRFTNGEYEYIVNYSNLEPNRHGEDEIFHLLVIKKDGKDILFQYDINEDSED